MLSALFIFLLTTLEISLSFAQDPNRTSLPTFHLRLTFEDGTIDHLSACHAGAAIETLCLSGAIYGHKHTPGAPVPFYFNETTPRRNTSIPIPAKSTVNPEIGPYGILMYDLPLGAVRDGSQIFVPSSAHFELPDSTIDMRSPILYPGNLSSLGQRLANDTEDRKIMAGWISWSEEAPQSGNGTSYARWWACNTYSGTGYRYNNLVWGLGPDKPASPSCRKVEVRRTWI